jgi:hypothetical protein
MLSAKGRGVVQLTAIFRSSFFMHLMAFQDFNHSLCSEVMFVMTGLIHMGHLQALGVPAMMAGRVVQRFGSKRHMLRAVATVCQHNSPTLRDLN